MAFLVKVLCAVILTADWTTSLTIDSQLVEAKTNCFIRVALGEKLSPSDTTRRVDTPSVSKCERECSEDKDRCNSFSFGISAKGNGTCELSIRELPESDSRIEGTFSDPDFDIYAKRTNCNDGDGEIQDPLVTPRPRPEDPLFEDPPGYGNPGYGSDQRPSGHFGNNYPPPNSGSSSGDYGGSNRPPDNSYGGSNRPSEGSGSYGGSNRPSGNSGSYGGSNRPSEGSGGYGGSNRPSQASGGYGGSNRPSGSSGSYGGNDRPTYVGGSYGSGSSFGSSSSNSYGSSFSYGNDNRPGSGGGSHRPSEDSTRPYDQSSYGSNQKPSGSSYYGGSGRPPGWSSNTHGSGTASYGGSSSGHYGSGNKPYGESGVTYGGGNYRPHESSYGSSDSNYYSSSNSYSSGSSSFNYGSSSHRPSSHHDYRPSSDDTHYRPSPGYHGDVYGGYAQDSIHGDRFEWNRPQGWYNRPYPTTYGDRFPYEKPGAYYDRPYAYDDYHYNRPQTGNQRPGAGYNQEKPIFENFDKPGGTYGSGYGNYVPTIYNDRPQRPIDYGQSSNSYGGVNHRPESVAQIYGEPIAVSYGSPAYKPDNRIGDKPAYRPAGYGTHVTIRPVEGYRGNGYDNLMPNSPLNDKRFSGSGGYGSSSGSYSSGSYSSSSQSYEERNHYYNGKNSYADKRRPSFNEIDDRPSYKPNYDERPISTYASKIRPGYDRDRPDGGYKIPSNDRYPDKTEGRPGQGYGSQNSKPAEPSNSGYGNKPENNGYGDNVRPNAYDKDKPDPSGGSYSSTSYSNNSGGYKEVSSGGSYSNRPVIPNERPDPGYGRPKGDHDRPNGYGDRPKGYTDRPDGYGGAPDRYGNRPSTYDEKPSGYNDRPGNYDERPDGYNKHPIGYGDKPGGYGEKPNSYGDRPQGYDDRPDRYDNRPKGYYDRPDRYDDKPKGYYDRPDGYDDRPKGYYDRPDRYGDRPTGYYDRPYRYDYRQNEYDDRSGGYGIDRKDEKPNRNDGDSDKYGGGGYNSAKGDNGGEQQGYGQTPVGPERPSKRPGQASITEIKKNLNACYRRVLAGKRVQDRMILGVVPCERLEDCQRNCAEERRFDCETFNYRLDPTNRGKGVCEMTSTPLSLLDLRNDFIEDRDYDFYELDRNSAPDCSLTWSSHPKYSGRGPPPWRPQGGYDEGKFSQSGYFSGESGHSGHNRRYECSGCSSYGSYRPPPGIGYNERYPDTGYGKPGSDVGHHYGTSGGGRYDWKGWQNVNEGFRGHSEGADKRWDRHFVPYEISGGGGDDRKSWGQYGGSYGYGGSQYSFQEKHKDYGSSYNYWGLDGHDKHYLPNASQYPTRGVSHYDHGYDEQRKHDHEFNYFNLGHTSHRDKWEGSSHHGSYGQEYGYGGGSRHQLHGLTPTEGYGPTQDRGRPGHGYEDDMYHGGYNKQFECSSRSGSGFRFSHGVVRKALLVRDVNECERICYTDPHIGCKSYSFRYTRGPSDNCFLSDRPYRSLDLYNDVQPDRDSDVYAMNPDRKFCRNLDVQGPGGRPGYDDSLESDCFWRVRSGRRLTPEVTKAALEVHSLAECEEECLRLTTFTCRAFSYRHGSPVIGGPLENCLLADSPASALSPSALVPAPPCALYERGSYGRGCEGDPFALDTPLHRPPQQGGRGRKAEDMCYLQYDTSAKLLPSAVRAGARLGTEHACKLLCADKLRAGRLSGGEPSPNFKCLSFSYTSDPDLPPSKDNCLLSDIQLRDLQPGLDYTPARTHWLFAYDTFDPECGPVGPPGYGPGLPTSSIGHEPPYGGRPGDYHDGPGYARPGPVGRPPGHLGPSGPPVHLHPDGPPGYLRPDEPPGHSRPSGPGYLRPDEPPGHLRPDGPGYSSGPSGPPGYLGPSGPPGHLGSSGPGRPLEPRPPTHVRPYGPSGYDGNRRQESGDLGQDTWSFFTVSGWPCRRGSRCAPNKIAGYWSCELEGGEVGSWDYCCHPGHHCGHSRGLEYAWCYVGASREQWRPCSEQYYPYAHSSPSLPHQGQPWDPKPQGGPWEQRPGYNDRHDQPGRPHLGGRPYLPDSNRRYWDDLYKNGPQSFYDEYHNPRPGFVRVPTIEKNHIRYHHNHPPPRGSERPHWIPVRVPEDQDGPGFLDPPKPGGFGVARYWPVSYLHKNGPPNSTYYKYDVENRKNSVSQNDNDRKLGTNDSADRRTDTKVQQKSIGDSTDKPPTTQVLSINSSVDVPRNGRDKENNSTKISDDGFVLISSSNTNKGAPDPMDKRGRITSNNSHKYQQSKDKLDDKIEKFSGEVFTVDEPLKITEKDAKANLERLLKEEKQIEEIGKAFKRRDDSRTSIVVEKRSQSDYGIRSGNNDRFEPVFVPVTLENTFLKRPEKMVEFEDKVQLGLPDESYSDSYRNYSNGGGFHRTPFREDRNGQISSGQYDSRNTGHYDSRNYSFEGKRSIPDGVSDKSNRNFNRADSSNRKLFSGSDQYDYEIKRHVSTGPTLHTDDYGRDSYRTSKSVKNEESVHPQNCTDKHMKSVVSNGQVFYEVSPESSEDKRPLGYIERVELKDHGVNVRVANERSPLSKTPESITKTEAKSFKTNEGFSNPTEINLDRIKDTHQKSNDVFKDFSPVSRSEIRNYPAVPKSSPNFSFDFVEATTPSLGKFVSLTTQFDQLFGARTGKVKKVELPFPLRNATGARIVKRGRRNFRLSYNPNEVRKRLLEKQKLRESEESGI